jgi:hypothetical protein
MLERPDDPNTRVRGSPARPRGARTRVRDDPERPAGGKTRGLNRSGTFCPPNFPVRNRVQNAAEEPSPGGKAATSARPRRLGHARQPPPAPRPPQKRQRSGAVQRMRAPRESHMDCGSPLPLWEGAGGPGLGASCGPLRDDRLHRGHEHAAEGAGGGGGAGEVQRGVGAGGSGVFAGPVQ